MASLNSHNKSMNESDEMTDEDLFKYGTRFLLLNFKRLVKKDGVNIMLKNQWKQCNDKEKFLLHVYRQCLIASNNSWELAEKMWQQICTNSSVRLDSEKKPLKRDLKKKIPSKNKEMFQKLEELFGLEYLSSDEELTKSSSSSSKYLNKKNKVLNISKETDSYKNSFDLLADLEDTPPNYNKPVESKEVSSNEVLQDFNSLSPTKEVESVCNSVIRKISNNEAPIIYKEKISNTNNDNLHSPKVPVSEQKTQDCLKEKSLNDVSKNVNNNKINNKSVETRKYSLVITNEVKVRKRSASKTEVDFKLRDEIKPLKVPKIFLQRIADDSFVLSNKQIKKETSCDNKFKVINEEIPIYKCVSTPMSDIQNKENESNQPTGNAKSCAFVNNKKIECNNNLIKVELENQSSSSYDSGIEIAPDISTSPSLCKTDEEKRGKDVESLGCLNFSNKITETINEMEIHINSDKILCAESCIKKTAHLFIDDDFLYKCDANPLIKWNTSKSQIIKKLITKLIKKFCSMDNNMIYLSSCFMRIFQKIVDNQPYTLDIIRYRFAMYKKCIQKFVKMIDLSFYKQWFKNKYYEDWLYIVDYILKDHHSMLSLLVSQNKMVTSSINHYIMNACEYFIIAKMHKYSFELKNIKSYINPSVSLETPSINKNMEKNVPLEKSLENSEVSNTRKQKIFPKISVKPEFSMKSFAGGRCVSMQNLYANNNLPSNETISNTYNSLETSLNTSHEQALPRSNFSNCDIGYNHTLLNTSSTPFYNNIQSPTFYNGMSNNLNILSNPRDSRNITTSDQAKLKVLNPSDIIYDSPELVNERPLNFNYVQSVPTNSYDVTTTSSRNVSNVPVTNAKIKCMGFSCPINAKYECLRCLKAYYCSHNCQTVDWSIHKQVCSVKSKTFF